MHIEMPRLCYYFVAYWFVPAQFPHLVALTRALVIAIFCHILLCRALFVSDAQQGSCMYNELWHTDIYICGNIPDQCLSRSNFVCVKERCFPLVPPDKFHPALEITVRLLSFVKRTGTSCTATTNLHNFSPGDYLGLCNSHRTMWWSSAPLVSNVKAQVSKLTQIVREGTNRFVPATRKAGAGFPRWYLAELKRISRDKAITHRKLKNTVLPHWETTFKPNRHLVKQQQQTRYLACINSVKDDLKSNAKNMFRPAKFRQGNVLSYL